MNIALTYSFTPHNFKPQFALWRPLDWATEKNVLELRDALPWEEWMNLDEMIVSWKSGDVLIISGVYCYMENDKMWFKDILLVIEIAEGVNDAWSYVGAEITGSGIRIRDIDKRKAYSAEEVLKPFYSSGYDMGSDWFDEEGNLSGAREEYEDYLASNALERCDMPFSKWLQDISEYQLETDLDQFGESMCHGITDFLSDWCDCSVTYEHFTFENWECKYADFFDYCEMENEFNRGSNDVFKFFIERIDEK